MVPFFREREPANMKTQSKEQLFEQMPVPGAVARLAIPTTAACLVMVLYSLADTYFVGRLNNPSETSAVTLAASVLLAFNAVTNLFGTGCASAMSRAMGVKDHPRVKRVASFGFWCTILFGLLFSLGTTVFQSPLLELLGADDSNRVQTADYLFWTVTCGAIPAMLNVVMANLFRAEGSALHASIGTMSGCLLNMVLDPLMILPWGMNLGAAGAGLATFLSNCAACVYFFVLYLVKRGKTLVSLRPCAPGVSVARDVITVGLPASIQNLLNVTGMVILNSLMTVYGNEAVSAIGISHKAAMVPMYISMGITQGIMPLVGYNFAAGNRGRMKETIRFTEFVAGGFMLLSAGLFYVFSEPIIRWFMSEPPLVVTYGGAFLKGGALAQPFLFLDFLAVGVFQACGMGGKSLVFAILRKIVLEIPALLVLNLLFPMYGLAYAQLVAEVVLSVVAMVILEKLLKIRRK